MIRILTRDTLPSRLKFSLVDNRLNEALLFFAFSLLFLSLSLSLSLSRSRSFARSLALSLSRYTLKERKATLIE